MESEPEIRRLGGHVVVIGNGAVPYLDEFASGYPSSIRFLTDPKRAAYRALSLKRGMGGARALGMLTSGLRAYRAGHRQAKVQGDPMQQGGVFVITPEGEMVYAQRSETGGDHADLSGVLGALSTWSQHRA